MSTKIFTSSSISSGQKQSNFETTSLSGVNLTENSMNDVMKKISNGSYFQSNPTSGGTLNVNGLGLNNYDYVVKRGDVTLSSFVPEEWFTNTEDSAAALIVVKGNLTINSGVTFQPHVRKLFTCILVEGNLTVNGTLTMTARGASTNSLTNPNNTIRIINGSYSSITNPEVPSSGGSGGAHITSGYVGNNGTAGQGGGSGGGGGGGKYSNGAGTGGAGAQGSAFSGGPGGGGCNSGVGLAGGANGGPGGNSNSIGGGNASGGGAGNPGGRSTRQNDYYFTTYKCDGNPGTGGTLIVFVTGTLSGSGTISSNGSRGGSGGYGIAIGGGGGSGGGSVTVLCNSGTVSNLTATGGLFGEGYTTDSGSIFYSPGGSGGNGTSRILTGFIG